MAAFMKNRQPVIRSDYGAAISLTFTLKPFESKTIPFAVVLDFPVQDYIDGKTFEQKIPEKLSKKRKPESWIW